MIVRVEMLMRGLIFMSVKSQLSLGSTSSLARSMRSAGTAQSENSVGSTDLRIVAKSCIPVYRLLYTQAHSFSCLQAFTHHLL